MFFIEIVAGLIASSTALLGDSVDMLGDSLVYGFSLYVVFRNDAWKSAAAFIKGGIMVLFGLFVLAHAIHKFIGRMTPQFATIGMVGLLALTANAVCLVLLWRHRREDVNMRSVWLCSRNDIIANISVLFAALGVWAVNSQWPDLIVGSGIAVLFLHSASQVLKDAKATYAARNQSIQRTRAR